MNTTKYQIECNAVEGGFSKIFDFNAETSTYTLKSEYHNDDIYFIKATSADITLNPKLVENRVYVWTRGSFICSGDSIEDVTKQYIPYYLYQDGQYLLKNEGISIADALNSSARTDLTGQNITISHDSHTRMAAMTYDTIGIAVASSDLNKDEPELMSLIKLTPQIQGDDPSEIAIESHLNGSVFKSSKTVLGDSISINILGDTPKTGLLEYGYLDNPINWSQVGDFLIHIVDINGELEDSYYAIRNGGVGKVNTPAYLATEDFVLQHAGGGAIDDTQTSSTTTWSSNKISSELKKSDRMKYYNTKEEWESDTNREIPCIVYIKESDKIIWDDGNVKIPYIWNFSSDKFSGLGTISEKKTIDKLILFPTMQVTAYRQTIDEENFTNRLYLDAAGSSSNKSVSFELTGNDDIKIYFQTANNRVLRLVKENGDVIRTFTGATAQSQTFHYSGEPCTVFLYMTSGSGYIYCIKLNDN